MSNKSISVFLQATKRQIEETSQSSLPSSGPLSPIAITPEKPIEESKTTSIVDKNTNLQESKHVSKKTSKQVNMFTSKYDYVNGYLSKKAYMPASYRLPPEIIDKFKQLYHLANGKYGSEITRYSVVVAALALFLWDLETNGEESDFYKLLIKKENK